MNMREYIIGQSGVVGIDALVVFMDGYRDRKQPSTTR
jgi:hypothetical protein